MRWRLPYRAAPQGGDAGSTEEHDISLIPLLQEFVREIWSVRMEPHARRLSRIEPRQRRHWPVSTATGRLRNQQCTLWYRCLAYLNAPCRRTQGPTKSCAPANFRAARFGHHSPIAPVMRPSSKLLHLRHPLEGDLARLIGSCVPVNERAFSKFLVHRVDRLHELGVLGLVEEVGLMLLLGS